LKKRSRLDEIPEPGIPYFQYIPILSGVCQEPILQYISNTCWDPRQ
jgi:hypothetical protein